MGNIASPKDLLTIGSFSQYSTVFTNMVNAVSLGNSIDETVKVATKLLPFTGIIGIDVAARLRTILQYLERYSNSPFKRFIGGETYSDFEGTVSGKLGSVDCTATTTVLHVNNQGEIDGEYSLIRYSGKKVAIVSPDRVRDKVPVMDFMNLFWDLLLYFKCHVYIRDPILWDMEKLFTNRFSFQYMDHGNLERIEREGDSDLPREHDTIWKPSGEQDYVRPEDVSSGEEQVRKEYKSGNLRLRIYCKDGSNADKEFVCVSLPERVSYSSTASFDSEEVRGGMQPYRFFNNHDGKIISFSVDLHQQEYSVSLQTLVEIATNFTLPFSNGDYSLKPKVVIVQLPGWSFEAYCTEVRVDYSSEHGWYFDTDAKGVSASGIQNANYGEVTLDFTFAVLENIVLQQAGSSPRYSNKMNESIVQSYLSYSSLSSSEQNYPANFVVGEST